jgi:hypothetical protein
MEPQCVKPFLELLATRRAFMFHRTLDSPETSYTTNRQAAFSPSLYSIYQQDTDRRRPSVDISSGRTPTMHAFARLLCLFIDMSRGRWSPAPEPRVWSRRLATVPFTRRGRRTNVRATTLRDFANENLLAILCRPTRGMLAGTMQPWLCSGHSGILIVQMSGEGRAILSSPMLAWLFSQGTITVASSLLRKPYHCHVTGYLNSDYILSKRVVLSIRHTFKRIALFVYT